MTDVEKTHLKNAEDVWQEMRLDAYSRLIKTAVELSDQKRKSK